MPSIHDVPTEMVLKILDGARLRDIVSLAQASSKFYTIAKEYRSLWLQALADDVIDIPIPAGHTIHTVPISSIFAFALRAVSIRSVLSSSGPAKKYRLFHKTDLRRRDPRTICHPIQGSGFSLIYDYLGNSVHLIKESRREDDELSPEDRVLHIEGAIKSLDLETIGNGEVSLTVLYKSADERSYVESITLSFSLDTQTYTHKRGRVSVVAHDPISVVKSSNMILCCTESETEFLLFHVERQVGLRITPRLKSGLTPCVRHPYFVPSLSKIALNLVIETEESRHFRIALIDIPEFPDSLTNSDRGEAATHWLPLEMSLDPKYCQIFTRPPYSQASLPSPDFSSPIDFIPKELVPIEFLSMEIISNPYHGFEQRFAAIVYDKTAQKLTGVCLEPVIPALGLILKTWRATELANWSPKKGPLLDLHSLHPEGNKVLRTKFLMPSDMSNGRDVSVWDIDHLNGRLYVNVREKDTAMELSYVIQY